MRILPRTASKVLHAATDVVVRGLPPSKTRPRRRGRTTKRATPLWFVLACWLKLSPRSCTDRPRIGLPSRLRASARTTDVLPAGRRRGKAVSVLQRLANATAAPATPSAAGGLGSGFWGAVTRAIAAAVLFR